MINFSPSTEADIPQLIEWIQHDPYHSHQGQPEWWLGRDAVLAFCLMDEHGPLCYVRLDREGEYLRLHTQFAPEVEVSKSRLTVGMIQALVTLREAANLMPKVKGFIFNSVSPRLIKFLVKRFGFTSVGKDDYLWDFEGQ